MKKPFTGNKQLKLITKNKQVCFNKVTKIILELQKEMSDSTEELSFLISKGNKLKEDNSRLFVKNVELSPYIMIELGVWEMAIESHLLQIDDEFMCHDSCSPCIKNSENHASQTKEMTIKTNTQPPLVVNTPPPKSSILEVQTPCIGTPDMVPECSDTTAGFYLKSPKDIIRKPPAKLKRRSTQKSKTTDNRNDALNLTPQKKRERSPTNNHPKEAPLGKICTPRMAKKKAFPSQKTMRRQATMSHNTPQTKIKLMLP